MEQDHWGFEDEKVAGVHWGYEETRTLLAILSQTELYEALRNCHRNSQVYGAVAERLQEYGFLRTLEQCRTKFKGLQKSYRKVKSGYPPETCPFFEEMEALMSSQVIALPSNGLEEAASHSGQVGSDAEPEEPQQGVWQYEEEAEEAQADESDSDEMDVEATSQDPDNSAAPVMFRSPSGKKFFFLRFWDQTATKRGEVMRLSPANLAYQQETNAFLNSMCMSFFFARELDNSKE